MVEDDDLRKRFRALRERERAVLPPFEQFVPEAARVHPLRALALPLAAAAVAALLWLGLNRPETRLEVEPIVWRGPTDVLLEGLLTKPLRELPRLDASMVDALIYPNDKRAPQPGDTP